MLSDPRCLTIMCWILWLVAAGLGGIGVASVWGSFHDPSLGIEAFMTLPVASFIILAMPHPPASPPRPPSSRAIAVRMRQFVAACRPRSRSK